MLLLVRRFVALLSILCLPFSLQGTILNDDDDGFTPVDNYEREALIEQFKSLSEFPGRGWHSFQKGESPSPSFLGGFLPENWTKDLEIKFPVEDLLTAYSDGQIEQLMKHEKFPRCLGLAEHGQVFWKKRATLLFYHSKEYYSTIEWEYFIFPPELYYGMVQSEQAILKDASLTLLPKLPRCEHLTKLNLSDNLFDSVPDAIQSLPALQKLNLHNNKISAVPSWIKMFTKLEVLDLSLNRLKEVPADVGSLDALQELDVSHNQIVTLAPAVFRSPLEKLNVSHNQFLGLPNTLGDCEGLEVLDVSHNFLGEFPQALGRLERLKILNASHNRLVKLFTGDVHWPAIVTLNVSHNHLMILPEELWGLRTLSVLDVSHNSLPFVSDNLGCLDGLVELNFSHNYIPVIPKDLGFSPYLVKLLMHHNLFSFADLSPTLLLHPSLQRIICDHGEIALQREYLMIDIEQDGPKKRSVSMQVSQDVTLQDLMN